MDRKLVIRAQQGDREAFTRLAAELTAPLLSVAHRILRDTELAEDAAQQALLNMWQRLPQLRDPDRFEAWSYRLLVRACYTEGRRARRWAPALALVPGSEPETGDVAARVALAVTGVVLNGAATAAYIGVHFGPGPRDGLMTGLVRVTGASVRLVRTAIEISVVVTGFLLGGTLGAITVLYALAIGPLTQLFLPLLSVRIAERGRS